MARKARKEATVKTEIKIAYVGGGSRYWAQMVMTDLALCPHLTGELVLYDINHPAAQENVKRARKIYGHPDAQTKFRVRATKSIRDALTGADFVFLSILPGPMQMFANDLDIPLKYGIIQTVGDTTGPGGISRALRTIPTYIDYAHTIMKYCPAAWVINYTNPMTLCTATLYAAEPGIKAFGCCHEVFGTQVRLAWLVKEYFGVSERPARQSIKTDVAGVNHFTFALNPTWEGEDLVPLVRRHLKRKDFRRDWSDWAREQKMRGEFFGSKVQVAWDFFERFGALGAAGDRHLVEFVPWYCTSEENLHRKGVLMTPSSYRLGTWQPPQNAPAEKAPGKRKEGLRGSGEEGVQQMLAICGIEPIDTNVNLPNQGQMPDMPQGAVVETNAQFRHDRVTPVVTPPLPSGVAALVRRVVEVQEMTLEAALHRDRDQAFAALLNDPLCTIPVDRAWKMFREMLRANKAMLPGWRV